MAGKNKYINIPSYMNNAKSSFKQIVSHELSNIMPGLSNTVVTMNDALKHVKNMERKNYNAVGRYVKSNKRYIYSTVSDFVKNAKEDLSTGKFYNEERMENQLINGIDSMMGNFDDDNHDGTVYFDDVEKGNAVSQFDKYLRSTSAKSSNIESAKYINEANLNNTDYLANVSMLNNTKMMTISVKQHMEQMKSLNNIEKIGAGILKFNQDILSQSLENRDKYLESILDETRELKSLIQIQSAENMARFKGTSSGHSRNINQIEKIIGSGGTIDIKEYAKIVKENIKSVSPISPDLLKTLLGNFANNPIANILSFGFDKLIGKDIKRSMKNLDKTISGAFTSYLLKMQKVKNNGNSMIGRLLAEILGVDMYKMNKPSLGGYKYKDMTAEIEQMKAKSITEVIPTYLSEITRSLTGIDKVYDYNKGIFINRTKQRKNYDKEIKENIVSDMYETHDTMKQGLYTIKNMNKQQAKMLEADLEDFIYFIGLIPEAYNDNMSYQYVCKLGLKLRGGQKSYNIIKEIYKNMPKESKNTARVEHFSSLGRRKDMWESINENLQSSGASIVYNKFREPGSDAGVFVRNGRYITKKDIHMTKTEIDNLDLVQIKEALSKGFISKEEARAASDEINEREKEERSAADEVSENVNKTIKNAMNKYKIKNPFGDVLGKFNDYIKGVDDALSGFIYYNSDDKRTLYERTKSFGKDFYNANKNFIYGDNGLISKKQANYIKRFGGKGAAGAAAGASIGSAIGRPIVGSIIGTVVGMISETEKVKRAIWGDGKHEGIMGHLKNTIDKYVTEPFKNWFKKVFKIDIDGKISDFKEKLRNNFSPSKSNGNDNSEKSKTIYDRIVSAKESISNKTKNAFGKVEDIFSTNDNVKQSSSTMDDEIVELVNTMERGIYSNQLDMIIYLLSKGNIKGRGINIRRRNPNNNRNNNGLITESGQYNTNTISGYKIKAIKSVNKSKNDTQRLLLGPTSQTLSFNDIMNTSQTDNSYLFNINPLAQNTLNYYKYINNMNGVNNTNQVITPNDIVVYSAAENLKNDNEYMRYINNISRKAKDSAKNAKDFVSGKINNNTSQNNTNRFNITGKAKDYTKNLINNNILKRGIGKQQGSLIGMALGTLLLGNPILGAIAGATFGGRNEQQKAVNDSLPKQSIFGTSMKYGAIAALMGINPMYGILLGSLFPRNKGEKKTDKSFKLFGKDIKLNKMIKGALAGGLIGNIPGAVIGGLIGHRMDHKNDWKYNEDGSLKTKEEIKEYKEQQKRNKTLRDSKGRFFDKFTGGGKLSGMALGGLGGLLGFGPMGLLGGSILGAIGSTSSNKLNRDKTQGILNKMGMGKWKSAVLGSIIANSLLLGPLGALGAGALAPIIGGSMGLLMSKGKDKRFWRYDYNGNLLSKNDRKNSFNQFMHDVRYGKNGQKRGLKDSINTARNTISEENKIRDDMSPKDDNKKLSLDTKSISEAAKKLEMFEVGKGKGTLKGAQLATAAGVNPLIGAAAGFLFSKKKKEPPKGFPDDPIYVRVKDNAPTKVKKGIEQKLLSQSNDLFTGETNTKDINDNIKQRIIDKISDRKQKAQQIQDTRRLISDFKTDTNALTKSGTKSAEKLILSDISRSNDASDIDNLYKRAMFLSTFKNGNSTSLATSGKKSKDEDGGWISKTKSIFDVIKKIVLGLSVLQNIKDAATLGSAGASIKNIITGVKDAKEGNYNSATANFGEGAVRSAQFATGIVPQVWKGVNIASRSLLWGEKVGKIASKSGFIAKNTAKFTVYLTKILQAIMKKFPWTKKLLDGFTSKIVNVLNTNLAKKIAAKGIMDKLGKINIAVTIAKAVYDFGSGMYETNNLIGVTSDFSVTTGMRFTSGFAKCISNLLFGIIPKQTIFDLIYGVIGSKIGGTSEEYSKIKMARDVARSNYDEFVQANPGTDLTYEQYQKITNKTAWKSMTSWIPGNKDKTLDKYITNPSYTVPDYVKNNTMNNSNQYNSNTSYGNNSNDGAGYVIQDNSTTYNITTPTDYGNGGRGLSGYNYLKNKIQSTNTVTQKENKTPLQTFLKVTGKENMDTMINSAVNNGAVFLNSIKDNRNIKNNAQNALSDSATRKNGKNVITNMASNIVDKSKKFGQRIWEGAKNIGSSAINAAKNMWTKAKNVGSKIKNGVINTGSSIINGIKSVFSGGRGDDPDYYNQQDPRWSNMNFGIYDNKRDTVGEGGCGPTTAATVIQKLTGRKVTPAETSKFALQNGYKVYNGGTTPNYFRAVGSKYGVNMQESNTTSDNTINNLRKGKPVIFLGHDSTGTSPFGNDSHYVIGTGMDNKGNVQVLDPKNRSNNRKFNIKDLVLNSSKAIIANGGRGGNVINHRRSSINKYYGGRGIDVIDRTNRGNGTNAEVMQRNSSDIKFIVMHYTDSTASADNICRINSSGYGAHYYVDGKGVYQLFGDNVVCRHCGSYADASLSQGINGYATAISVGGVKCCNENSIGIEVCGTKSGFLTGAVDKASEFVKTLMSKYNIDVDHVVRHCDCTSTDCPGIWKSDINEWNKFKNSLGSGNSGSSNTSNDSEIRKKWLSVALAVKQQIANQKPGYNQNGSVPVTINGETINVRTDCSGYVSACLHFYGVFGTEPTYTGDMVSPNGVMKSTGFIYKRWPGWDNLNPGDILVIHHDGDTKKRHTEIFVRNDGNTHYVYNCGSSSSTNNPGETHSSKSEYDVIWQPCAGGSGVSDSGDGSSTGDSAKPAKKNMLNILSGWFDNMTSSVNNPLSSVLGKITESIDGNSSSNDNNSSSSSSSSGNSSNTSSSGSVSSDDLSKTVSVDQALNRNSQSFSNVSSDQLKTAIDSAAGRKGTWLSTQINGIMQASAVTGIDPRFIAAKAAGEAGWDGSQISRDKHNMFGIGAADDDPYGKAKSFSNDEEGWIEGAKWFKKNYIDIGQNSFYKMKNPEAAGVESWHSYQTGDITPKAKIYADMINATGGAGRGSSTDNLYKKYVSKSNKQNRRSGGRGLMTSLSDIQSKGGLFGYTSYLNKITESIDGSTSSSSSSSSGDSSNTSSNTSTSSNNGSPSNGSGAMGSGDTYRNSTFGTTSRCKTITVPSGLGTTYTYESWQGIKYYNAGKLKTESGQNFDGEGFGKIGDRFVVAMTSTFGIDGDYVNIKLTNGQTLYAVIGDEKDQTTAHGADCANKWGHNNGNNIVEFIVDYNSWYNSNHPNVGQEGFHTEMSGVGVVSVENIGNYWGSSGSDGGRGSNLFKKINNSFINKFKNKSITSSTNKPSISIPSINSGIKTNIGNAGMAPIPSIRSVSQAIADKNYKSTVYGIDNLTDIIKHNISGLQNTSANNDKSDNTVELAMLEVLKSIASTLERIEQNNVSGRQNNIYAMPFNNDTRYNPNTYKNDIMRSIATGR